MSNISENRINVVIPATDITIINNSVETIISKIPANTTLTDAQRAKYNAIDVGNKVFAEDCLVEAQLNGADILPPYINLVHLQNDLAVFEQLDKIESALMNVLRRITDAKRIAGHEGYVVAGRVYTSFKNANKDGIANATASYEKLKKRFEAQGGNAGRNPGTNV